MRPAIRANFLVLLLSFFPVSPSSAASVKIAHLLRPFKPGEVSFLAVRLSDGAVLAEKESHRPLNPASTAKLATAAAALSQLGPDFTFKTEFYAREPMGEIVKGLWVKGFGDPLFVTEELEALVGLFKAQGLKGVEGDILVDDTYFDRDEGITYLSDEEGKVYRISTGPLSFNFNTVEILAQPGRKVGDPPALSVVPPTRYVTLINEAKTGGRRWPTLEAEPIPADSHAIRVRGNIPRTVYEYRFRRGILDPAAYTGTVILEALQNAGISVSGGVRREAVPPGLRVILSHSSPPLKRILEGIGKHSNNFVAEQLFKTLGAVRFGPPASLEKGRRAVADYLLALGIQDYYLENGSGLSKLSRLSAGQLVRILQDLYGRPWRDDLISSLSVAGVDGTLKTKLTGLRGRVFAKTGTLNGVNALAGYLDTSQGPVAFALLLNDVSSSSRQIERLAEAVLKAVIEEASSGKKKG